ncbi:MAG TPA: hypothetical protein VFM44_09730 [Gemmatimonadota bacterium]|nr:hypothetical protein [Gemmatimonadota bacterium]
MAPRTESEPSPDRAALVRELRERISSREARREAAHPTADASFQERYDHLLGELVDILGRIPEIETEPIGSAGIRLAYQPTEREVRITALEEQGFVHFVFGHATLGTLHRAEHHASHPFGETPPDVSRLVHQLIGFLIEGIEPRWLSERPEPGAPAVRADHTPGETLELPLE